MRFSKNVVAAVAAGLVLPAFSFTAEKKLVEKKAPAEIRVVLDVSYANGDPAEAERQKLDVYLPANRKDFPVVLFLHGTGFQKGGRKDLAAVGSLLARHGIGVVAASYRLHPQAKHPAQIQDAAKAFAWVKKNIADHGGKADRVFVAGFSSGAHLVSLLATDERYLKAEGLSPSDIKGVVAISGLYRLPEAHKAVFGDEEARKEASPITHVKAGLPPFLLAHADKDTDGREKLAREFAEAIKEKKGQVEVIEAKDRDHDSLFRQIAEDDETARAIVAFILRQAGSGPDSRN
jgi:acetyl esterase/lipase